VLIKRTDSETGTPRVLSSKMASPLAPPAAICPGARKSETPIAVVAEPAIISRYSFTNLYQKGNFIQTTSSL